MNDEFPDLPPQAPRKPDALELLCVGILRTEFGRRPSSAVENAITQLAAEEAVTEHDAIAESQPGWRERINHWLARLGTFPKFAVVTGLVLFIGLSVYYTKPHGFGTTSSQTPLDCTLTDAADARWAAKSPNLKINDQVPHGWLRLESGVVEITFASTAKIAVEGPAQFQLTGRNSIQVQSGKLATDVPKHAKGFIVRTPTATIIDLGTRFGAIVGKDKSSEVDVFQGRVSVGAGREQPSNLSTGMAVFVDERGATPGTALPETAFPQPNLAVEVRPQNCGFDVSGRAAIGGVPADFGYWSGLSYALTGDTQGVHPANGPGMLEFCNPSSSHGGNSEVWQVMDLRPYKKLLASGQVVGKLTALFNHSASKNQIASRFGLALAAYHGSPANASTLWNNRQTQALACTDKELASDNDPETWEPLEANAALPPETDFVIIQIRAMAPTGNTRPLTGCFADLVNLRLCTPLRGSSIAFK